MQHDHDQKLNFEILLLTPPPVLGGGGGGSTGKIFAIMLLHVSFSLIGYATLPYSEQSLTLASAHTLSPPRGPDPGLLTKIPFSMFHIHCSSVCEISVKRFTTD